MDMKVAKQTFLDIKKVLDGLGVRFWLVDGTALGAVRDGGFIPWDKDMDLRTLATEWDFSVLFKRFENEGFRCVKSINPRLYGDKPSGSKLYKRGIKTDICLNYYYPQSDEIVVLAGKPRACVTVLPAKFFRGDHFIDFLGTQVRIPNPPEEYLEYRYGKNWRTPIKDKGWPVSCKPISIAKYVKYFINKETYA